MMDSDVRPNTQAELTSELNQQLSRKAWFCDLQCIFGDLKKAVHMATCAVYRPRVRCKGHA